MDTQFEMFDVQDTLSVKREQIYEKIKRCPLRNEADFKRAFKKSIMAQGGYAISLAAPMIAGIPDLYILMPKYIPILVEAKWLGEIDRIKFKRKVPYSEMQKMWIKDCHNVLPYSAMGLVGFEWQSVVYGVMCPYNTDLFESITNDFINFGAFSTLTDRKFNVSSMIERIPIPQLTEYYDLNRRHIRTDGPGDTASASDIGSGQDMAISGEASS